VPVFSFPKDETRKRLWLDAIPRFNFVPTKRAAVCIRHFEERFAVRFNTIRLPDGTTSTVKRDRIKLTNDAIPTLFKNEQATSSTQADSRCDTGVDMENNGNEVEDGILNLDELQTHWITKYYKYTLAISIINLYSSMYSGVPLKDMFDFKFSDSDLSNVTTTRPSIEESKIFENVLVEAEDVSVSDETLLGLAYINWWLRL
jgi:hypothetical protein